MRVDDLVKNVVSIFVLGYVIVFFTTLFKGVKKLDPKVEMELASGR